MTSEILSNLNIVTMPTDEAVAKFQEYKAEVKRSHRAADKLMAKTFKALAAGQGVLSLHAAIKLGGVHTDTWLPRLAVMRADMERVFFKRHSTTDAVFAFDRLSCTSYRTAGFQSAQMVFVLPSDTLPRLTQGRQQPDGHWQTHSAPVPPIPPNLRPADALSKYVILWEIDSWTMEPPVDPILLKPIGGQLYAVIAHWDLSPVERLVLGSIMAGRNG